jgi:hypothetical protein
MPWAWASASEAAIWRAIARARAGGQRTLPGHHRAQRVALEVLHRDEQRPAGVLPEVVDADGVGVAELGRQLGLGVEAPDQAGVGRQLGPQDLDRDLALERDLLAAIDRAHAALAELGGDAVAPGDLAADQVTGGGARRWRGQVLVGRLGGGGGAAARAAEPGVRIVVGTAMRTLHRASIRDRRPAVARPPIGRDKQWPGPARARNVGGCVARSSPSPARRWPRWLAAPTPSRPR